MHTGIGMQKDDGRRRWGGCLIWEVGVGENGDWGEGNGGEGRYVIQ